MFVCLISLVVAPSAVFSQEDPIRKMSCRITKACAPNGDCLATETSVLFRFKTSSSAAADEGPYEIEYGNVSADLWTNPMSGTYMWTEGQEDIQSIQWMGAASEDEEIGFAIWTQARLTTAGSVKFLTCKGEPQ